MPSLENPFSQIGAAMRYLYLGISGRPSTEARDRLATPLAGLLLSTIVLSERWSVHVPDSRAVTALSGVELLYRIRSVRTVDAPT